MTELRVKHLSLDEQLCNIILDCNTISEYLTTGCLSAILNSSAQFSHEQIHSLLSSFNQFKAKSCNQKVTNEIFTMIIKSKFISDSLEPIVKQYFLCVAIKEEIEIVMHFFVNCLELFPDESIKRMTLLYPCVLFISAGLGHVGLARISEQLTECLEKTKKTMEGTESKSALLLPRIVNLGYNDFRKASIFPQTYDIFSSTQADGSECSVDDRENCRVSTLYVSVDDFLSTQFYLQRRYFLKPLSGMKVIINDIILRKSTKRPLKSRKRIFENVIIEDLCPSQNGLVHRVLFDVSRLNKNISLDTIFPYGSLVCLANSSIDRAHFGTVVDNSLLNLSKGILTVEFLEDPMNDILRNNTFLMLETTIKIDVDPYVLKGLQSFTTQTFPFKEYFVSEKYIPAPPKYLRKDDLALIEASVDQELDDSEKEVFVKGLQCNVCLIAGAGCTGKNSIGVKMMKLIMDNFRSGETTIGPMLLVCFTKKVLEKFLSESSEIIGIENVVWIGGSRKNEVLRDRDVVNIKHEWIRNRTFPFGLFQRFQKNRKGIETLEISLVQRYKEIMNCQMRLLSFSTLSPLMTPLHVLYFKEHDYGEWVSNEGAILTNNLVKYTPLKQDVIHEHYDSCIDDVSSNIIYDVVIKLLEEENKEEHGKENVMVAADVFRRSANIRLIKKTLETLEPVTKEEYNAFGSLDVDFNVRLKLYKYWQVAYRRQLIIRYENERTEYDRLNKEKEEILLDEYFHIMKDAKLIAMTTSSAARYRSLLDKIRCKVVFVEEANKVPECHLVCSLSRYCEKLIMFANDRPIKGEETVPKSNASFFERLITKGCQYFDLKKQQEAKPCGVELSCGHLCPLPPHQDAFCHTVYICEEPCRKLCARKSHVCKLPCSQQCRCDQDVTVTLICGHKTTLPCCEEDIGSVCTKICDKMLNCGHQCRNMCSEQCKCQIKKTETLSCGHRSEVLCGEVLGGKCVQLCQNVMTCGHLCKLRCWQSCACEELVKQTLPCSHTKFLKCGTDKSLGLCVIIVHRQFDCGHRVGFKCFEQLKKCNFEVSTPLACGHSLPLGCGETPESIICKRKCDHVLNCRHACQGSCGECYRGRLHVECKVVCGEDLKCGHRCPSTCHAGLCPPCKRPCEGHCGHILCSALCGNICDNKVCTIKCRMSFKCATCKIFVLCPKLCGETCSKLCVDCLRGEKKDHHLYHRMEPCSCYILKNIFRPKQRIEGKKLYLLCPSCRGVLLTPYHGVVLIHFKAAYAILFQLLEKDKISKWKSLFDEFKKCDYLSEKIKVMVDRIETTRISKESAVRIELSFKFYVEILEICKNMPTISSDTKMERYRMVIKKSLLHLMEWLDPFVRLFGPLEICSIKLEQSKLSLSSRVLSYLNSVTVTDYGLIHKQSFEILDEIENIDIMENLEKLSEKVVEIQKSLKNTRESTKEEEELVEKIISTKNIFKDFGMSGLSNEEKLKEIMKLIRGCHPDKNPSSRAKDAVNILLGLKKRLAKKIAELHSFTK